jgi:regulator of protease activity HflC (stomatin/prohibitin superfamily)
MTSIGVVQFNEIAFLKAWGQSIDQTKVFDQGRYMVGFWNEFVTFPATVIDLQLKELQVFSSSEGDDAGTTLNIDVGVQYVLNPDRLSDLFDIGGQTGFITQIEAEAIETIKNAAPEFSADEYLTERRDIEAIFKERLTERIAQNFAVHRL